ncbi:unnamed protein product, partial [Mesorhabditis belari]|uniref:Fibronectin type-III domain-containing protein n=1 Tax=Mesorhabditis belari TaxID=2138241 RepID=A0AAF3J8U4_9BILA
MLSFLISFLFLKPVNGQGVQTQIFIPFLDWSESLEPVEVIDVRNDRIDIHWRVPEEFLNATTKQRLVVAIMKEQELQKRHPKSFHVEGHLRDYTFINLQGNTSYRVSVEAFSHDGTSLWYGSNVAKTSLAALNWLPPPMELMTSFLATRLNPGNVYNITIQAGTTFGYGSTAWIATNTLAVGDSYIIKQKIRTPNSIIVAWPSAWMGAPNAKFS